MPLVAIRFATTTAPTESAPAGEWRATGCRQLVPWGESVTPNALIKISPDHERTNKNKRWQETREPTPQHPLECCRIQMTFARSSILTIGASSTAIPMPLLRLSSLPEISVAYYRVCPSGSVDGVAFMMRGGPACPAGEPRGVTAVARRVAARTPRRRTSACEPPRQHRAASARA
jgi:hypothetical protein